MKLADLIPEELLEPLTDEEIAGCVRDTLRSFGQLTDEELVERVRQFRASRDSLSGNAN